RVTAQVGFRDAQNGFAMFGVAGGSGFVVYHTRDGGSHWVAESCACGSASSPVPDWLRQDARSGLPPNPHSSLVVTAPAHAALLISAGGTASGTAFGTSADDGSQWSGRAAPYRGGGVATVATRGGTWWLVAAPPGSGRLIAMSQDAGATWSVKRLP